MTGWGPLALTMTSLAAAAIINTGCVVLQQRTGWLTRRFGSRAWFLHLALISPGWLLYVVSLPLLGEQVHWPLPPVLTPLGAVLLAAAAALLVGSIWQLGPARVMNGYFFGRGPSGPVRGGVFRWLRDPMYHAFWLLLAGWSLVSANAAFLPVAAESFLFLNLCEARVENRPFSSR